MRIIRNYIFGEILISVLSVLCLFVGLFSVFDVIQGVADGEHANIGFGAAAFRSALEIPSWIYELIPLSALTGSLIALARMSASSEYVVMRSSGMTLKSLAWVLSLVSLGLCLLAIVVGEVLGPKAHQMLQSLNVSPNSEQQIIAQTFRSGHWIKDRDRVVNITKLTQDFDLSGISIFELNVADRSVKRIIRAESGTIKDDEWVLSNAHVTDIYEDRMVRSNQSSMALTTLIKPKILNTLLAGESDLTYFELASYIEHLENSGEDTYRYRAAQWSKIGHLITIFLLVLIAPAFVGFENRGRHIGFWIFLGTSCGVGLYFLTRLLDSIGAIGRWHPFTYTLIPIMFMVSVAYYFISRRERR